MKVSIIIPYKIDRGWLKDAVASVPPEAELILAQGDGNWPQNFNKGLKKATGDLIKFLHEDDMLSANCISESIKTFEEQGCDLIHGKAVEIFAGRHNKPMNVWYPAIKYPTLNDMLRHNYMHSATLMYRREVFEKIGGFNESSDVCSFEEFEFNLRCLMNKFKVGYCDSILAFYRRHPNQCIRTVNKQIRAKNRQELINSYK